MANTMRTCDNLPQGLENMEQLEDIDLSGNKLDKLPKFLTKLQKLRRLKITGRLYRGTAAGDGGGGGGVEVRNLTCFFGAPVNLELNFCSPPPGLILAGGSASAPLGL